MKKTLIFTLLFFCVYQFSFAQKNKDIAPLNPDFIKYIEQKKAGNLDLETVDGYKLGKMPNPYPLNFTYSKKQSKKRLKSLPASYDLRDEGLVTRAKDQGALGSCWSFAAMGCIESRWIKLGYGKYDLSEQHMATCHGFEQGIDDGGYTIYSAAYLSRHNGPILETQDPYTQNPDATCKAVQYDPVALVPETRWLPVDEETIKDAIMKYGAVESQMHVGQVPSAYMSAIDYTFYYGEESGLIDHGVLLVGWDDNKEITGGFSSPDDNSVGAWIVKNSWGEDWGDDGFFYVAYNDTRINGSSVTFYPEREEYDSEVKLYMYDKLGAISNGRGKYGLVKYEATGKEFVNEIGTYINQSGTVVNIEIYDDFIDGELSNMLGARYNQLCDYPGYYKFDVAATVNDDFYVKIFYDVKGSRYCVPIEYEEELFAAYPQIESGVCWISTDGEEWEAVGNDVENENRRWDVCIRAYSTTSEQPIAFFTADKRQVCNGSSVTFSQQSYNEITSYSWSFGNGASPETATGEGPHEVVYSASGTKEISLTVEGPNGTDTKTQTLEVVDGLDVLLVASRTTVTLGKTTVLTALADAETFEWSPTESLNSTFGSSVVATPPSEGSLTYNVEATQGACVGNDSLTIEVVVGPPNDDVCNAIMLLEQQNGPFSNENASVEENEPMPEKVDCEEPLSWCDEGGLQNSVWFKFEAPQTGNAHIDSYGFDNQLAVYDAETCEDILDDNYILIAANDDYYPESKQYAAAIERLEGLVPGKTYWVQMDGSAGGAVGEAYLSLHGWFLDAPEIDKLKGDVKVYPNPSTNGLFELKVMLNEPETVGINVFDMQGKLLLKQKHQGDSHISTSVDLAGMAKGVYYLQVVTENAVVNKKLVIE